MASGLMEEPLDSFVPTERTCVRRLHASEGGTFHFATRLKLAHAPAGEPAPPGADSGGTSGFAEYAFFCNSGAEAMEGAIKCARKYHPLQKAAGNELRTERPASGP
jgi:adenosylmethionine-8-amino-7-oxononanoate aminotransferase